MLLIPPHPFFVIPLVIVPILSLVQRSVCRGGKREAAGPDCSQPVKGGHSRPSGPADGPHWASLEMVNPTLWQLPLLVGLSLWSLARFCGKLHMISMKKLEDTNSFTS